MEPNQRLEEVAAEYRREGYAVLVRPRGGELPGFLSGFEPDIVGTKAGGGVVVAVVSREDLSDIGRAHLAGLVNSEPGWRFDMVVPEPRTEPEGVRGAEELSDAGIRGLMSEARRLSELGFTRAALLTSWSAVEAAMRSAVRRAGIAVEGRKAIPAFLLKQLFADGVLSRPEFDRLSAALALRNAAVHGFAAESVGREQIDFLIDESGRLLELQMAGQP